MTDDFRSRTLVSLSVALLLALTLFFFTPVQIYLTNILEFDFQFTGLIILLLVLSLAAALLVFAILFLLSRLPGLQRRAQLFIFALGVLVWLQGNFLVWRYGPLDGRLIPWNRLWLYGAADGLVWLAVLALVQWKAKVFSRLMKPVAGVLILFQLLLGVYYFFSTPPFPPAKKFLFVPDHKFAFSQKQNVILLVIDVFQSDLFAEVLKEDPAVASLFPGFTYYRNNLGGFPVTYASIPLILTGKRYDNSRPIQSFIKEAYLSPSSLPRTLKQNGVEVDLFPANTQIVYINPEVASNVAARPWISSLSDISLLLDITLFKSSPHFLKRAIYNRQKWLLKRWLAGSSFLQSLAAGSRADSPAPKKKSADAPPAADKWRGVYYDLMYRDQLPGDDIGFLEGSILDSSADAPHPVFKYYHLMGIHDPFFLKKGSEEEILPPTRENWKRIIRIELNLVHLFLKVLKKLGIYDNSLIFVMGDHGHPRGFYGRLVPSDLAEKKAPRYRKPKGIIESGTPLLLVKRFGDQGGPLKISDAPVATADIAKTVFGELHIRTDCPGESIFEIPENAPRPRTYYFYTWTLDDWKSRYLPPLFEFRVEGHSHLCQDWKATGRVLRRPE